MFNLPTAPTTPTARALPPFVELSHVRFDRGERCIFKELSLTIPQGSITAVMGPSGCGKSTLLQLITGALQPVSGTVTVAGQNVHSLTRRRLFKLRRRMGMLFQSGALFTHLSVFENIAFPLREHLRLPEKLLRDLVLMKLEAVGLRGARDLMANELSGGMARRVALARALALDPELILYDEPFTGQDPITMGVLVQLIKRVNDALGITSIIVSHDVAQTASIADYSYVLSDGGIVGEGTPEVLSNSDAPAVKQFLSGLPDGVVPFHYPSAKSYAEDLLC